MSSNIKKEALFLVAHRPGRSPGQRFRFEQYVDFLKENNWNCEISFFINEKDDKLFYSPGKIFAKLRILLKSIFVRFKDIRKAKKADVVFVYRDAISIGSTYFERRLSKINTPFIIDFDDTIWKMDISDANKSLSFLKKPEKTIKILQYCDVAFVGNKYLADFAKQYAKRVEIIPTTLITQKHKPAEVHNNGERVCLGWTGTSTTLKHYTTIIDVLERIEEKYNNKVWFKLIADVEPDINLKNFSFCKWTKDKEVEDLYDIDIGLMPLPNDEWSRGKCGFKGLQYMSIGAAAIMSPVGVNTEIVEDGVNGFLADTKEQWFDILSKLIDDEALRQKIGAKGRETVVEKYSYESLKDRYLELFNELSNA